MGWSPGDRIGADFRLVSPLGERLRVWKAKRLSDDQAVAVTFASDGEGPLVPLTRARFAGGAKLRQELDHPRILESIGFGVADSIPYTVSPLIDGESLAARLRRERVLPQDTLLDLLEQLASAVDHAHGKGVIHRDLRPDNILLAKGDELRLFLIGFELAHRREPGVPPDAAVILPTHDPAYAAPEMPKSPHEATARSDLFSVAAVAYHGLLGRPLVTEDSPAVYVAPTELSPFLPAAIDRFFEHALAADPGSRFEDAATMVDHFAAALGLQGSAESKPGAGATPLPEQPPSGEERAAPRYPTLDAMLYLTVAVAALLAGAALASLDGFRLFP